MQRTGQLESVWAQTKWGEHRGVQFPAIQTREPGANAAPCRSETRTDVRFSSVSPVPVGRGSNPSWSAVQVDVACEHVSGVLSNNAPARLGLDGLRSLFETITTSVSSEREKVPWENPRRVLRVLGNRMGR